MDPIHAYLTDGILPTDRTEAKTVRRRSARYLLLQGILYRCSYSLPLLRCPFGRDITGPLSTQTPPGSCRNTTLANASARYRRSLPNHSQFDCSRFRHLCSRFNISIFFASPAHPQSNGQAESSLPYRADRQARSGTPFLPFPSNLQTNPLACGLGGLHDHHRLTNDRRSFPGQNAGAQGQASPQPRSPSSIGNLGDYCLYHI
ncbi:unnamed protein product [Prunus brigantina]